MLFYSKLATKIYLMATLISYVMAESSLPSSWDAGFASSVSVVGDNILNFIDNMKLEPSTYLTNQSSIYSVWNVTLFHKANSTMSASSNKTIHLLSQTALLDVDDLQILINDENEKSAKVKYEVSIDESILPQNRYKQYDDNVTNSTASDFDVACRFVGGGIYYNISSENISSTITNINSEGPIILGLQGNMLMINIPDDIASNFIQLREYLNKTNQNDPNNASKIYLVDIFLNCPNRLSNNYDESISIECTLVGRELASTQIIIYDIKYYNRTVFVDYLLSFRTEVQNGSAFIFSLKNLQFYNNLIIVGLENYGVGIYSFYAASGDTQSIDLEGYAKESEDNNIFELNKLKSDTHVLSLEKYFIIEYFNDLDLYRFCVYIIAQDSGLSIIDLRTLTLSSGLIRHPSFISMSLFYRITDANVSTLFIGIEVENDPEKGIPEFFVELVVRENLLTPTINKIFMSENRIMLQGAHTNSDGLTSLLDTIGRRLIVIQRGIPNTINLPLYQILIDTELKGTNPELSQILPIYLPDSYKQDTFLLTTNYKSYLFYNLKALSFDYSCKFTSEYDYILLQNTFSLCGTKLDSACKIESTTLLEVRGFIHSNIIPLIVITVVVTLLIIIAIALILYKRGYCLKVKPSNLKDNTASTKSVKDTKDQAYYNLKIETDGN